MGSSSSSGSGGVGKGWGGDDSNSGAHGKIQEVKEVSKSPSLMGSGGMIFSAGESKGGPDKTSAASVPYTEVYSNYSRAAEKALTREKVPPAYRARVKQYFNSLK